LKQSDLFQKKKKKLIKCVHIKTLARGKHLDKAQKLPHSPESSKNNIWLCRQLNDF
jgi:hypothetical protein